MVEPGRRQREAMLENLLNEFSITHLQADPGPRPVGRRTPARRDRPGAGVAARFVLLDEPLAGIDPIAVADIRDLVSHLKDRGIGVLITDHNVRETLEDRRPRLHLHDGHVLMEGRPAEIVAHKDVRRVYLGRNDLAFKGRPWR